jgi:3-oxoacyl-[acyl-carrier-protein] synthase III
MAEQVPILGVEITGLGSALPRKSVSNEELIRRFEIDSIHKVIHKLSGIGMKILLVGFGAGMTAAAAAVIRW